MWGSRCQAALGRIQGVAVWAMWRGLAGANWRARADWLAAGGWLLATALGMLSRWSHGIKLVPANWG